MAKSARSLVTDPRVALALLGACVGAALTASAPAGGPNTARFVLGGDACGASAFAHLVGEEFATLDHAALPADTHVNAGLANTLQFEPQRLNVILDRSGRVAALGCF